MKSCVTTLAIATIAIGAGTIAAACSPTQRPAETSTGSQTQQQFQVPDVLKVPVPSKLVGSFDGTGVQIYGCAANAWTLLQPAAILSDNGKPVAVHSKGPVWISTIDGSAVVAAPVPNAAIKHADAVPELLLKATENHGVGQFGSVTYIQRLATKGGLAPNSPCLNGSEQSVAYSAIYRFYSAGA